MGDIKTNIITNITEKRNQIKGLIDDFATFQWRGADAWEKFGVFIINEKSGSLKFYNGPSFNNEYSTPMFSSSSGNLMGVNFKIQPIKFKIGMYWFTIEEYQEFIEWINPYEINYLSFGFESGYGYLVKLAGISDSPRHIIGHDANGKPVYYTEMELSWEIQGNNCVRSNTPYEWNITTGTDDNTTTLIWKFNIDGEVKEKSLLDTPVNLEIPVWVPEDNSGTGNMSFNVSLDNGGKWANLFNVGFENLIPSTEEPKEIKPVDSLTVREKYYLYDFTSKNNIEFKHSVLVGSQYKEMLHFTTRDGCWGSFDENDWYEITKYPLEFIAGQTEIPDDLKGSIWNGKKETVQEGMEDNDRPSKFTIRYDSETGIVFIKIGSEDTWKILSYLTDTVSGDYLVNSTSVNKYLLPGEFTNNKYEMSKVQFELKLEDLKPYGENPLTIYSRKNVI